MTLSLFREVPVLKQIEQKNRHFRRIEVVWRSPPHPPKHHQRCHPPPHHHYRQHTCKTEAGAVHISQCVSLTTYLKILIGPLSHHPSLHLHLLKLPLECIHSSQMRKWHLQWISCWNAVDPLKCLWSQGPLQFYWPLAGLVGTSAHVIEPNLDLGSSHTPPHKQIQVGCNIRTLWKAPAILVTSYWACWHLSHVIEPSLDLGSRNLGAQPEPSPLTCHFGWWWKPESQKQKSPKEALNPFMKTGELLACDWVTVLARKVKTRSGSPNPQASLMLTVTKTDLSIISIEMCIHQKVGCYYMRKHGYG